MDYMDYVMGYYIFGLVYTMYRLRGVSNRVVNNSKNKEAAALITPMIISALTVVCAWAWIVVMLIDLGRFIMLWDDETKE